MRKSPQDAGHAAIPLLLLLVLCVLFMVLTPVASALSNASESNDGYLAVSAMHSSEDGKVTDDDGRIGNGHSGADHAEPNDPFQNGITGGAERGVAVQSVFAGVAAELDLVGERQSTTGIEDIITRA
jgi:hypothetical protein